MAVFTPENFPLDTVLDVEDKITLDPGLLLVNNNEKKLEGIVIDDEIVPRRQRTIAEGLRPLLASMRMFGLYFSPPSEDARDNRKEMSRKWNAYIIYAIAVVVLLWINAIRAFSVFTHEDEFGFVLLNKFILINWCIQCAVSQTAFYAASFSGRLAVVFNQALGDSCARHARKVSTIYATVAWLVIMAGFAFIIYGLFFTGGDKDYFITPLQNHILISNPLIPRIIVSFVILYVLSAHTFTQATTFVLATIFSHQFMKVNETLRRVLDSDRRQISESDIETLRQEHQQISMNVSHVDDCLMFSNASAFCCQVFSAVILLYMITFYHSVVSDAVFISCYVFWLSLVSVGLALTAAGGIMVHHYVR